MDTHPLNNLKSSPFPLLDSIQDPADLRKLPEDQLPALCSEIRQYLIETLSVNPGHFGSSMGAVEIIVALHYVFNTPEDHIVFDVGHQAYAHKLLTGRKEQFQHQRTLNGLSGFPFPAESKYDTFVCGHAGNSISAALGMAIADETSPSNSHKKTVALIGDASIGNGLAFEGLNNVSNCPNNLLIVLNDNDMSIDDNVGALHRYLSDITTSKRYNQYRFRLYRMFRKAGLIEDKGKGMMLRFSNALKSLISQQQNIFEGLNIRYFGPVNGNDVIKLVKVLRDIKDMKGPRLLHIRTVKGKGFQPAESDPAVWHAPGKFDPDTGNRNCTTSTDRKDILWQDVFGTELIELCRQHDNVVAVTAAMTSGTSVGMLQNEFPQRMYDVGISEGHAVTFAGGLAAAGKHPYVAIYSSFLQRAVDNIIHDIAIQKLPVTLCIDRAGLVGEDGVTHHGMFDIIYLRMIPGFAVAAPSDAPSLRGLMQLAYSYDAPMAIRYPRGKAIGNTDVVTEMHVGKGRQVLSQGNARTAILALGPTVSDALQAANKLKQDGIEVDVYDMIWVKPLDNEILKNVASKYDHILTVEDGSINGGFGSAVMEWMRENNFQTNITVLGIPDKWIFHGKTDQLKSLSGYDSTSIEETIKGIIGG